MDTGIKIKRAEREREREKESWHGNEVKGKRK